MSTKRMHVWRKIEVVWKWGEGLYCLAQSVAPRGCYCSWHVNIKGLREGIFVWHTNSFLPVMCHLYVQHYAIFSESDQESVFPFVIRTLCPVIFESVTTVEILKSCLLVSTALEEKLMTAKVLTKTWRALRIPLVPNRETNRDAHPAYRKSISGVRV